MSDQSRDIELAIHPPRMDDGFFEGGKAARAAGVGLEQNPLAGTGNPHGYQRWAEGWLEGATNVGVGALAVASRNVAIGERAGHKLRNGCDNCLIGIDAGADLTDENGITIIGDGIRSLDPDETNNTLFIGSGLAIGGTLFGEPCNLKALVEDRLWGYGVVPSTAA